MPYDPTRVAKLVTEFRKTSGMTWRDMAAAVDCSSGTLRAIAKGDTRAMRLDTAYKLAEAMKVEIWHLIGDEPAEIIRAREFSERMSIVVRDLEDKTRSVEELLAELRELRRLLALPGAPRR